jgi:hypothetical protein
VNEDIKEYVLVLVIRTRDLDPADWDLVELLDLNTAVGESVEVALSSRVEKEPA